MQLPTNQDYWLQPALDRLQTEKNKTPQKSLILLLWYAQTDASNKAIASFAADRSKPAAAVNFARQILKAKTQSDAKHRSEAKQISEDSLPKKHSDRMNAVSDAALMELDDDTMILAAKRK